MQFLNPIFLFSALSIAIPIALHFWHTKKSKKIDWAAMKWLLKKDLQPSKGFKFENLLLLFLRCLIIFFLTLWLAALVFNFNSKSKNYIHLVEPNQKVIDQFRFELETAIKKNEKVYFIQPKTKEIENLNLPKSTNKINSFSIQNALNEIGQDIDNENIMVYLSNKSLNFNLDKIYVPANFELKISADSSENITPVFELKNDQYLGLNQNGTLEILNEKNIKIIHRGSFNVSLNLKEEDDKRTILAALAAISKVFGIEFEFNEKQRFELVFGEVEIENSKNNTLFLETTSENDIEKPNLIHLENYLSPHKSELSFMGKLPELILGQILTHYKLTSKNRNLSLDEIKNVFEKRENFKHDKSTSLSKYILLLLLISVIFERYLAFKKNS